MNNTTHLILLLLLFSTTAGICEAPNGASLHGTFIDAANGQPISDVLVRAAAEKIAQVYPDCEFEHATATGDDGTFSLTIPNEPRTYYAFSLMALHPQYQAKRLRHEMSPGKNKYDLGKIALKRTLTLKGSVSGEKNLAGLVVNMRMHTKSGTSSVPPHPLRMPQRLTPQATSASRISILSSTP